MLSTTADRSTTPPAAASAYGDDTLAPAALEQYRRDGFTLLPDITTPQEVADIRAIYDAFFASRRGWEKGDFFDAAAADDSTGELTLPTMFWLSRYEPKLAQSIYHRRAAAYARQLLGPDASMVWEFAILKPARTGAATPWHQDAAFFKKGTPYQDAISFWLPLQDVNAASGCMEYAPGTQSLPLLPHDHIGGDPRTHFLEARVRPTDIARTVLCPMTVGSAVVHHSRTLHYAGPNTSDVPRRALILEFAVVDPANAITEDYPWTLEKHTNRDARERSALPWKDRLRSDVARGLTRLGLR